MQGGVIAVVFVCKRRRRAAAAGRAARVWVHGRRGVRRRGVCVCVRRRLRARVEGGRRRLRGAPKSYAFLVSRYLARKHISAPPRASRVRTAAHRCSRGASGRNKEFRVACFSHSTTMRETTVCYLRPKTRPNRQGGGPSCERASTPGRSFRKRWLESARSLQYWLAAGSRRKPPSCLLPSRVQVCRAATGAGVRGSRSSPSGAPLASRGASRRRPSASP